MYKNLKMKENSYKNKRNYISKNPEKIKNNAKNPTNKKFY